MLLSDLASEIKSVNVCDSSSKVQFVHKTIALFEVQSKIDSQNQRVAKTNKSKIRILSKCAEHHTKKLRFIKEKEASGLLSSLGIKAPLNQISLVGLLLF